MRRAALLTLCALIVAAPASSAAADGRGERERAATRLDPANPEDAVLLHQKVWCSLEAGKPALLWSQGSVYGHVPGEPDRRLFDFQIWNARACRNVRDPKRGLGYRSVSREIMLYIDPQTNQLLRRWRNPWTGELVDVIHTQNDPVNMAAPMYAYDEQGRPSARFAATIVGGRAIFANEAPLFYDNPLGGPFQEYVGGRYHAMEMLNVYLYADELLDRRVQTLTRWSRSWKRISTFLPWMRMGDRPGHLLFTAVGQRVPSVEQLPEPIRGALRSAEFAKYQTPPPLDDARPNETSWTYFRRIFDQRASGAAAAAATPTATPALPAPATAAPTSASDVSAARVRAGSAFEIDQARDCGASPARPVLAWYQGRVYTRRAGEKDRHVFSLQRLRTARCITGTDATRGRHYRVIARDLTLFVDPQSGETLQRWRNPWNEQEVPVVPVAFDALAEPTRFERAVDGNAEPGPRRFMLTDKLLLGSDAEIVYQRHPLGSPFPSAFGGALELLDYTTAEMPLARLRNASARDTVLSWGQVTPWLPWMRMGGRQGLLVIHAAGMQLDSTDQLPPALRAALATPQYARFAQAPEADVPSGSVSAWLGATDRAGASDSNPR